MFNRCYGVKGILKYYILKVYGVHNNKQDLAAVTKY